MVLGCSTILNKVCLESSPFARAFPFSCTMLRIGRRHIYNTAILKSIFIITRVDLPLFGRSRGLSTFWTQQRAAARRGNTSKIFAVKPPGRSANLKQAGTKPLRRFPEAYPLSFLFPPSDISPDPCDISSSFDEHELGL